MWCWKTQSGTLKNTECKHVVRWCGPSPAVFVFDPLWRGLLSITLTVPSDRPNNMRKWQYAAHLDHPVGGCRNEERSTHARLDQTMVVGKNNGISWIDDYVMNPPRQDWTLRSCETCHFVVMTKILHVGKFDKLVTFSDVTEIIYMLKLRTSMLSWLRTQVVIEWPYYWSNTQSQNWYVS